MYLKLAMARLQNKVHVATVRGQPMMLELLIRPMLGINLVLDRIYPEAKSISSWGLTQLHYLDIYLQTCVYCEDAGIGITCNKQDRGNARYVIIEKRVITAPVTEEPAEEERLPKMAEATSSPRKRKN
jgi:hypothetical protein